MIEFTIGLFIGFRRYFYDADAIREAHTRKIRTGDALHIGHKAMIGIKNEHHGREKQRNPGKNKRSVWTQATQPYPGSHYAVWPPALVEPMIKAGSAKGDIVLDPFFGSGTTGIVARKLGRQFVGLDISHSYLLENATKRLELDKLQSWGNGIDSKTAVNDLPLFAGVAQ